MALYFYSAVFLILTLIHVLFYNEEYCIALLAATAGASAVRERAIEHIAHGGIQKNLGVHICGSRSARKVGRADADISVGKNHGLRRGFQRLHCFIALG